MIAAIFVSDCHGMCIRECVHTELISSGEGAMRKPKQKPIPLCGYCFTPMPNYPKESCPCIPTIDVTDADLRCIGALLGEDLLAQ